MTEGDKNYSFINSNLSASQALEGVVDRERYYSVAEAAEILAVEPVTIRRLINGGKFPVLRPNQKLIRIPGNGFANYLESVFIPAKQTNSNNAPEIGKI